MRKCTGRTTEEKFYGEDINSEINLLLFAAAALDASPPAAEESSQTRLAFARGMLFKDRRRRRRKLGRMECKSGGGQSG